MPSPIPVKTAGALMVTLFGLMLGAGCQHAAQGNRTANYPIGEQFPQIYQKNLQASAHWQLIAHNEAQLLVNRFEEVPALQLSPPDGRSGSPFLGAYYDFLAEGLLNEGALVFDAAQELRVHHRRDGQLVVWLLHHALAVESPCDALRIHELLLVRGRLCERPRE